MAHMMPVMFMILSGAIAYLFGMVYERRKLRQSERRIQALQSELADARDARIGAQIAMRESSAQLSTTSHEMRTPLNGVVGMLSLLLETQLSFEQRNYAETANGSARILLSTIDEVLDTAKPYGDLATAAPAIDIFPFAERIVELLAPRAHAKGIEISLHIDAGVPNYITCDEVKLRQVFYNLIGNAIKFTNKGGVAVEIAALEGSLRIVVADTGIGMSADEASRVFEEWQQATPATQSAYGGNGLGLAICRQLVQNMNGKMSLTTSPGLGSAFQVLLPLAKSEEISTPLLPLQLRHFTLAMNDGFSRSHLLQTLTELGAEVSICKSPSELVRAMRLASTKAGAAELVCGGDYLARLRGLVKRRNRNNQPLPPIWILLKPEERSRNADLLKAPYSGYLLCPLRRKSLLEIFTRTQIQTLHQVRDAMWRKTRPLKPSAGSRPLHVLLAEDNPVNALLCRTILEKLGHHVTIAGDGLQALEILRKASPFDLAMLDVEMPKLRGTALAKMLRHDVSLSHRRHLPLLALTANAGAGDVKACLADGFDAHLGKPFDWLDLQEQLAKLVKLAQAA